MAILYQNSRKLVVKVDDYEIVKKILFLNSKLAFTLEINIFHQYKYTFKSKKDFKIFLTEYEDEIRHIEFMKKYHSGEVHRVLNWWIELKKQK